MAKDFYHILGVERDADAKTLKSAYRKKVMQYHPDRNPDNADAELMFKTVSEAYEILSDPQKRDAYDRFGEAAFSQASAGGNGKHSAEDLFNNVFGDVFSEFFGSGSRRRDSRARGTDLRRDIEISLEEAFTGTQLEIAFSGKSKCETCSGSGSARGSRPESCSLCNGMGRVRRQQGFFTMEHTCPQCQGRGEIVRMPCPVCKGVGMEEKKRQVRVEIPAGIDHGQRIRLNGQGEPGPQGGPSGDLYVFVSVSEHEFFQRNGVDLSARASIPMTLAALGGDITLPTIEGKHTAVTIPEGTQTGTKTTISGHGMPDLRRRNRGNMIVEIFVETPRNLKARQKDLLREFSDSCSSKSHPESASFLGKVKSFFDRDNASP